MGIWNNFSGPNLMVGFLILDHPVQTSIYNGVDVVEDPKQVLGRRTVWSYTAKLFGVVEGRVT